MTIVHKYVPMVEDTTTASVIIEANILHVECHRLLLGGDQLTVKRACSARAQRSNSEDGRGKLEGFIPFVQDWHAGMCFMQVSVIIEMICYYI